MHYINCVINLDVNYFSYNVTHYAIIAVHMFLFIYVVLGYQKLTFFCIEKL